MDTKKCTECECEKSVNDFYHCGIWYQSKCKPCHNAARGKYSRKPYEPKPKKPTGFNKLSFETKVNIIKDIQDGKKYSQISRDRCVGYATLQLWKKKGLIKLTIDKPIKEAK